MKHANPFTPTFGQVPPYMAGRNLIIAELASAFDSPGRAPELTTLISGARGCGKTALLTRIEEEAGMRGWVCVSTVAFPGMLEDIYVQAIDKASHIVEAPSEGARLTELGIGQLVNLARERGGGSRPPIGACGCKS